jgi:hypothetical protein
MNLTWEKLGTVSLVLGTIHGIESFGNSQWRGRIIAVQRNGQKIRFHYDNTEICFDDDQWRLSESPDGVQVFDLETNRPFTIQGGYRVNVMYVGTFVITPPWWTRKWREFTSRVRGLFR